MSEFCTLCNFKPGLANCSSCHQKICSTCSVQAGSFSHPGSTVFCSDCSKDSALKEYEAIKNHLFNL